MQQLEKQTLHEKNQALDLVFLRILLGLTEEEVSGATTATRVVVSRSIVGDEGRGCHGVGVASTENVGVLSGADVSAGPAVARPLVRRGGEGVDVGVAAVVSLGK